MATEQAEFREAYQATKVISLRPTLLSFATVTTPIKEKIDILFERLKEEYAVRDQLWVDVSKALDDIGMYFLSYLTT